MSSARSARRGGRTDRPSASPRRADDRYGRRQLRRPSSAFRDTPQHAYNLPDRMAGKISLRKRLVHDDGLLGSFTKVPPENDRRPPRLEVARRHAIGIDQLLARTL